MAASYPADSGASTMTENEIRQHLHRAGMLSQSVPRAGPQPAWYLRAISGCGAWLACLFLLGFWMFSRNESLWLGVGLAHCAVGCALAARQQGSRATSALANLALALWLTGLPLCILAFIQQLNDVGQSGSTALLLGLASMLYPEWSGRLLTLLLSGTFAVSTVCYHHSPLPPDLFTVLLPLLAGFSWLSQGRAWAAGVGNWTSAFGYASLATLWLLLGACYWGWAEIPITWVGRLSLMVMVLWLVTRILYRLRPSPLASAWALGGTLLVALLTHPLPGVLVGLGILLLAFEVSSSGLLFIAGLYWVHFLPAYVYDLSLPLTFKAILLGTAGGLLLLLRHRLLQSGSGAVQTDTF